MKVRTLPATFLTIFTSAALSATGQNATRPNFVFILGEGHGWSSTSVQMDAAVPTSKSASVRTPNLEKLAASGMRFANFYAPSPRCTPSRVALLTGKSPAQLHMTFINEGKRDTVDNPNGRLITPSASMELPTSEMTLANVLKNSGYATAHFGKWHMGRANPSLHGFDENDGKGTVLRSRPELVVHFPHYDKDPIGPASAIYLGDFKLIRIYETGRLELFDIAKDPGERHDLAAQMPDKANDLNQRLTDYLVEEQAQMPRVNPNYDASKPTSSRKGGRGKGRE